MTTTPVKLEWLLLIDFEHKVCNNTGWASWISCFEITSKKLGVNRLSKHERRNNTPVSKHQNGDRHFSQKKRKWKTHLKTDWFKYHLREIRWFAAGRRPRFLRKQWRCYHRTLSQKSCFTWGDLLSFFHVSAFQLDNVITSTPLIKFELTMIFQNELPRCKHVPLVIGDWWQWQSQLSKQLNVRIVSISYR